MVGCIGMKSDGAVFHMLNPTAFEWCKKRGTILILAMSSLFFCSYSSHADDQMRFAFPVDCTLGVDCSITKYFDLGVVPVGDDYMCGNRTFGGHAGVDIAVRNWTTSDDEVSVLAAAPGRVRNFHDGEKDEDLRYVTDWEDVKKNRSCGNYVTLDHGGGWFTQYCHMRYGSVAVLPRENVHERQKIGEIGISGYTVSHHLHFSVWSEGDLVDPFSGRRKGEGCGSPSAPLWKEKIPQEVAYEPVVILDVGLTDYRPDWQFLTRKMQPGAGLSEKEPIYVWADVYGAVAGDQVEFEIYREKGKKKFSKTITVSEDVIKINYFRQFLFVEWSENSQYRTPGKCVANVHLIRKLANGDAQASNKSSAIVR
jgi:Peptidase family M23